MLLNWQIVSDYLEMYVNEWSKLLEYEKHKEEMEFLRKYQVLH